MNFIDQLTINTIRILSAEAIEKAQSGHPGLPMGAAPMTYTLWSRHMKFNSKNPKWIDRDRFILSAGHGSMLQYSLLHLFGYDVTLDDIKNFRQFGSITTGHPEYETPGVETTTGPLGQGITNGVGMAIAEAHLAAKFNRDTHKIVDHYTYVLAGDGCMMEGIASEAASLAGTLGLGKLIVLYDSNNITIEGNTDIAFREDVGKRFEAYDWQVLKVADGNSDIESMDQAIRQAKAQTDKPSLIIINTEIGYGCPQKQGKSSSHGEPLGQKNLEETKANLNWEGSETFYIPDEVKKHMKQLIEKGLSAEEHWNSVWASYKKEYPKLAAEWEQWHSGKIDVDLLADESLWIYDEKSKATRTASFEILNKTEKKIPNLIGGSADVGPSTKAFMNDRQYFSKENYAGSNIHFGVREFAMSSIANGMMLHGGIRAFVSNYFVFSDYMKPAIRLSALMKLPLTYIFTHDSIGVGEDGPTHQPIEQLASLRSIPNLIVFRPADAKETAAGWHIALTRKDSPTALVLTRQDVPSYQETSQNALKGAYILLDSEKAVPDIILMASGSEVHYVYEAAKQLKEKNINARVVSMPSWELFEEQTEDYKNKVLPKGVKARLAVEAASSFGWHKYIGNEGDMLSIDTFGVCGPARTLFKEFGFTVENVVNKALALVKSF